jgi:uncharacterized protein YcbK (DUF882 family)
VIDLYPKNKGGKVAAGLWASEMDCNCSYDDCTFTLLSPKLKKQWTRFRSNFSAGLHITSGFRCQRHNKDVGGHPESYHMKGMALDIVVPKHLTCQIFANTARQYFETVIEYPDKNFIHVNVT